jgi:uncharacterized membrane protein
MSTANRPVRSNPPFPEEVSGALTPAVYSLTDLGVLPDMAPLLPVTLNDLGDLAAHGYAPAAEPDSWKVYGYVIKDGRRTQSLIPPGKTPISGLNAAGLMCGSARRGSTVLHAWATHLGWFGADFWPDRDSFCAGINAGGAVVGHVAAPTDKGGTAKRAFVVSATGQIRLLIPPWGDEVCAVAINDAGAVLLNGSPQTGAGRGVQTWLWQDGRFTLLEHLGGDSWGASLTPAGRVAGHALTPTGERHAVLWTHGRCYDLNPGSDCESEALAVNDQCTVVGRLLNARGVSQAFRWTPGDGMRPLNDFVAYADGWVLQKASCLNARGQIAGVGLYEGRRRGFLLTPEA